MTSQNLLTQRQSLTELLYKEPYSARIYLKRAVCYEELGFPDLAAGDAYKALLLIDEIQDESGEYHERALRALIPGGEQIKPLGGSICNEDVQPQAQEDVIPDDPLLIDNNCSLLYGESYRLLTRNLSACGSLKSAYNFCSRGLELHPEDVYLTAQKNFILEPHRTIQLQTDPSWNEETFNPKVDLPDEGTVRRELYPWNTHEPNRFSSTSLEFLNAEMAKVAPKCIVRTVELPLLVEDSQANSTSTSTPVATVKQLGIFTTASIAPGERVLYESTILTANNRLHDPLCDACSAELPPLPSPSFLCPSCDDTVFCSASCLATALETYHPAVCGKDIDDIGRDTDPKEAANALYLLLLGRTMALAGTQDVHPLDLKETKYIWGDFIHPDNTYVHAAQASDFSTARHLPFSFQHSILGPLHLLERMDVDVFACVERYDFWVFNTLYAKFRGTASARLSTRDGRPEVCAVHPMWCLANHSCAPNVRWEWGGEIEFRARKGEEVVRWGDGDGDGGEWKGGLVEGEEVLNHYCDVELDVKARREWAIGALGGMCVCERCIWEESWETTKKRRGEVGPSLDCHSTDC